MWAEFVGFLLCLESVFLRVLQFSPTYNLTLVDLIWFVCTAFVRVMEDLESHEKYLRISFSKPGKSWNFMVGHKSKINHHSVKARTK